MPRQVYGMTKPGTRYPSPTFTSDHPTGTIRICVFGDSISGACSTNSRDNGTAYNISGITKAASAVVTETGSTLTTVAGDTMYVHSVSGMTQINDTTSVATAGSATTATLPINSSAYTAYAARGKIYPLNNTVISTTAQGFIGPMNALMGQRFYFDHQLNRGIGGNSTADMTTRKAECLATIDFDVCVIMGGTNDIGVASGTPTSTYAQLIANLGACVDYVVNTKGKIAVLGTVPPADDNNATQIQLRKDLNAWIRLQASRKVLIWDYWDAVTSATDTWKTGYSYDGVHPNPYGGHVMGMRLRDTLLAYYGYGGFTVNANNLLLNPLLSGTGGTLSGTAATNNGIATNWTFETAGSAAAGTRILSKSSGDDRQMIAVNYGSGLGTGERVSIRQSVTSGLVDGAYYVAECLIQIIAGTGTWYEASLELRNQSSGFGFDYARRNNDPLAIDFISGDVRNGGILHLKTQPIMKLSTWTELRPRINMTFKCDTAAGTGTMKIIAAQLYRSS